MVFNTGVLLGRFQHIHIGHEKLIEIGLSICDKLLIFVGSASSKKSIRNPYDVEYRINLIEKIYKKEIDDGRIIIRKIDDITNENDLTYLWGEYVIAESTKELNSRPECIIYGKDKNIFKCFSKNTVKNITEVMVDRDQLMISATKMREFLLNDDEKSWKLYSNEKIHMEYKKLRNELLKVVGGNMNEELKRRC